jgi:exodeoxyribonuclease VII large subunit
MMFGNREHERAIGLAELAGMIEGVISDNFSRGYWVKAEMARLNLYPESGHCYPDLVEKESGKVLAQMRGTIWAGNYQRIAKNFLDIAREPLKDGLQILFFATVKFHPQYGLSLQISDIDPTFTLGQMARDRMETLRRLREEDIFDNNRSLPFPALPKRLAVISVQTSKGYSDFMQILESHSNRYNFHIALFPALLQGDRAVASILEQLKAIRRLSAAFDAVAIIRGGGGDVGLSCYDDYRLAKEVATYPLPVITGIGHSTNETVVELVAARNKITPTDVAYFLVSRFRDFEERLWEISDALFSYAHELIGENKERIQDLAERLEQEILHRMNEDRRYIDTLVSGTLQQAMLRLRTEKEKLAAATAIMRLGPPRTLRNEKERWHNYAKWLASGIYKLTDKASDRLDLSENRIRILDPVNTLKRGFSITYHDEKPLRQAAQTNEGDMVKTRLYEGEIISIIKKNK